MKAREIISHLLRGFRVNVDKRNKFAFLPSSPSPRPPELWRGWGMDVPQWEAGDTQTARYPVSPTEFLSHGENMEISFKELCLFYPMKSWTSLCFFHLYWGIVDKPRSYVWKPPYRLAWLPAEGLIPAEDAGSVFSGLEATERASPCLCAQSTGHPFLPSLLHPILRQREPNACSCSQSRASLLHQI